MGRTLAKVWQQPSGRKRLRPPRAVLSPRLFATLRQALRWTQDRAQDIAFARVAERLQVRDLQTGQELATVAMEGWLGCVALAPDGVTMLAGDGAGNVYCLHYVEDGEVTK